MNYIFPLLFWFSMLYFVLAIWLAFFIPGSVLLKKQKLYGLTHIVVSFGVGMVLWGLQGLVFGYLHIRWASYIYLAIFLAIWLKNSYPFHITNSISTVSLKKNLLPILLISLGVFIQLSTVWFNGIPTTKGDYYCCGEPRDNILHIAITKSFIRQVPPLEPGLSNVVIKNYHYLSSAIVGELVRVFHLPLIATDFQYMTIFMSVFLGLSLFAFGKVLVLSPPVINWILFFFYFGGDLVFGLVLLTAHKLSFAMSSLEDGTKFLANYPRAFGVDEYIVGLILLFLFVKNRKSKMLGILLAIVVGSLISLKVYVGIFALVGLFTLTAFQLLRKNFSLLPYAILALLISLVLYVPVNAGAGGIYFTGFWLFENFITQSGFHLIRWELARIIYQQHNSYLRVLSYEFLYIAVYVVAIFGTKILGIFQTKKSFKQFPIEIHIFLLSGLLVSFVAGSFFQQSAGSGANSFNFLVSVFIFGSFYTALAVWYWTQKIPQKIAVIVAIAIILITVPRVLVETYMNIGRIIHFEGVFVPTDQLQTFTYMNATTLPNSVVLVDQHLDLEFDNQISYVYIYTNNNMYLSGQNDELEAHGIDYKKRQQIENRLQEGNRCLDAKLIEQSPIDYILTAEPDFFNSSASAAFVTKEYENGAIRLLKVNKTYAREFLQELKQNPKINCFE